MAVQQGTFLLLGRPREDVVRNLIGEDEELESTIDVVKLICPKEHRVSVLRLLREMNVGRDTLFPDLDGLARSTVHAVETLYDTVDQRALKLAILRPSGWPNEGR